MIHMEFRSNCPLSCSLDLVGDKWSLVIVRDLLFFNKKTFKDLSNSKENIATNILAARLKNLEMKGILTRNDVITNKKTKHYILTEKGKALKPVLKALSKWGDCFSD
ncbi:helix-turn-helix transcriptional regulator [Flavobacteriales bacterium]|jgi:DNA-binding HxlR family transcriptional regulator|nr:helix-turn-helix transcriptional regulator [Flavobacteriales bacterium]